MGLLAAGRKTDALGDAGGPVADEDIPTATAPARPGIGAIKVVGLGIKGDPFAVRRNADIRTGTVGGGTIGADTALFGGVQDEILHPDLIVLEIGQIAPVRGKFLNQGVIALTSLRDALDRIGRHGVGKARGDKEERAKEGGFRDTRMFHGILQR